MSKLLKDVVEYLNERYDTSMRQISSDMGKGTNFIQQTIKRDNLDIDEEVKLAKKIYYTNNDLELFDLFALIKQQSNKYQVAQEQADEFERQLIKVNEENRKLESHCCELKRVIENRDETYNVSQKQRKDLEDRLNERSSKNRELEHQIVILQKKIDEDQKEYEDQKNRYKSSVEYLDGNCSEYLDKIQLMTEQQIDLRFELSNANREVSSLQKSKDNWFTLSLTLFFALIFTSLALRFLN